MAAHQVTIVEVLSDDASVELQQQGACVCGWVGQRWETVRGAEIEAEWHEDHPGTGEVPQIGENT